MGSMGLGGMRLSSLETGGQCCLVPLLCSLSQFTWAVFLRSGASWLFFTLRIWRDSAVERLQGVFNLGTWKRLLKSWNYYSVNLFIEEASEFFVVCFVLGVWSGNTGRITFGRKQGGRYNLKLIRVAC